MSQFKKIPLKEFIGKDFLVVDIEGDPVVVLKKNDIDYSAMLDRCSHADVALSDGTYDPKTGTIECYAHGAKFCTTTGNPLCMPAVSPVKTYKVKVVEATLTEESHLLIEV